MIRRIAVVSALVLSTLAVPHVASGDNGGGNNNSCPAPSGDLPTLTSVTVDGVAVPFNTTDPGEGKLFAGVENNNGQAQMNGNDCVYPWSVSLRRDFGGVGPNNGGWSKLAGLDRAFLDNAAFVQKFKPSYVESPAVTSATTVVAVVTLPDSGTYSKANLYWLTSTGPLEGNTPIVRDGNTVTITGHPGIFTMTPEQWPTGTPTNFNPLTANVNTAYQGNSSGQPNGFNQDGPFGEGGAIAQNGSRGLAVSYRMTFNSTSGKGNDEQRGMWFETVNTPRWSIMYGRNSDQSPTLTFGMGNYHEYYDKDNNVVLNSGSLRVMLPDAWAKLGFGVDSSSNQALIDGAIQVVRQDSTNAAAAPVAATNTAVAGQGIIIDLGSVTFSTPNFTAKKNSAVTARVSGSRVTLTVKLTKAQAKKYKTLTIYGGTKKVKKLKTIKAKTGTNSISLKYVNKNGYVIKAGKKLIGSVVPVK